MEGAPVRIPIPSSRGRHVVEGAIALVVLLVVMAAGWWLYNYFDYRRPLSRVDVYVSLDDPLCRTRSDSPVFIGLINNSDRMVTGMKFVLKARNPASGKNIQSDFTYTDNNRIAPGDALGDCWPVNYEAADMEQSLDARTLTWRIARYSLDFAD